MAKKKLLSEQHEELLKTLKARFEKNMNRHKGLEWVKVQAKLEANPEKLWVLDEMEITGGEPDVVGYDKRPVNTFFMTAQQKALKTGEMFVTIMKHWRKGKNINQKIVLLIWLLIWVSRF